MSGKTRLSVIILAIVIFVLGLVLIISGYSWFVRKQARVLTGTARPDFPYRDYGLAELNKMYPQYIDYSGVPDKQTPEQTHALFLAALKKGDFDAAVNCCFREGDRVKQKEFLNGVKEKGMLSLMIGDLSRDFEKEYMENNSASYSFSVLKDGLRVAGGINFVKTSEGIWYIESL